MFFFVPALYLVLLSKPLLSLGACNEDDVFFLFDLSEELFLFLLLVRL